MAFIRRQINIKYLIDCLLTLSIISNVRIDLNSTHYIIKHAYIYFINFFETIRQNMFNIALKSNKIDININ